MISNVIKISLLFFLNCSIITIAYDNQSHLSVLVSYGHGDNSANAKISYRYLYPSCVSVQEREDQSNQAIFENVHSVKFAKDSLMSSIRNASSYVQDLCNTEVLKIGKKPFVAIGHSRGAEMLVHYVGQQNPQGLKALILVGTPVSVGQAAKSKLFGSISSSINPEKINASICRIKNKELPIMLLHQQKDKLVSVENSKLIYKELKKQGFKNVHLVILTSGGHNNLCDDEAYDALQAFYAQYQLSFDQARNSCYKLK